MIIHPKMLKEAHRRQHGHLVLLPPEGHAGVAECPTPRLPKLGMPRGLRMTATLEAFPSPRAASHI